MKYKVWDRVRYFKNTTGSDAIVWEEYYIISIDDDDDDEYSLWKTKGEFEDSMWVNEEDIELVKEFTPWEQVACNNKSKENAIEDLKTDECIYYYIWKTRDWRYVIEDEYWYIDNFKYIAKIPKVQEMTLEEISKELWREVKIIK